MSLYRRAFGVTLLFVAAAAELGAQRLRGTVLLPDSISPAGRVIVIASDTKGADVAKTTSGEAGEFDLSLPRGGRYRGRVVRLGFRPPPRAPPVRHAAPVPGPR